MTATAKENILKVRGVMAAAIKDAEKKGSEMTISIGKMVAEDLRLEKALTNIPELDILTRGGISRGRVTEFWGRESSGKSTLSLIVAGQFFKKYPDMCVVYSNNEHTFDPEWARILGVPIDDERFIVNNATTLEDSLNFCIELAKTNAVSCMIIDSMVGLASRKEMEDKKGARTLDDSNVSVTPRVLSQFFRMAIGQVAKSKMALIFTNQVRVTGIGSNWVHDDVTGGNAAKHYKGTSLELIRVNSKADAILDPETKEVIGYPMRAIVTKDKTGARERDEVRIPFIFGEGMVTPFSVIMSAVNREIIEKKGGGRYDYGEHSVRGAGNLVQYMVDNNLVDEIRDKIYTKAGIMEATDEPKRSKRVAGKDKDKSDESDASAA